MIILGGKRDPPGKLRLIKYTIAVVTKVENAKSKR
jgi:hypothetical protein